VIRAQRGNSAPEGYVAQRTERGDLSFARTLRLQSRIDSDKIEAQLKDGILELRLPKQAEARARSIAVKSA
jgi:HSP20 family protein